MSSSCLLVFILMVKLKKLWTLCLGENLGQSLDKELSTSASFHP